MKKSTLTISIIVVLIVLAFGYYYLFLKPAFVPIKPIKDVPCSGEFYEAQNKLNVTLCEFTTETSSKKNPYYDNVCRELCIGAVAFKKGDVQICTLINSFKDISHVEGWDDPREIGSYKDHCYIHLASKLDDVSLCKNVETDWAKENCLKIQKVGRLPFI